MNYVTIETLEGAAKRFFLCMAIGGFFLVLLSSPSFARDRSHEFNIVVPESWTPSLDQLKETLEASSKTDSQTSQQAMNLTPRCGAGYWRMNRFISCSPAVCRIPRLISYSWIRLFHP